MTAGSYCSDFGVVKASLRELPFALIELSLQKS